jgi:hypothetical protein
MCIVICHVTTVNRPPVAAGSVLVHKDPEFEQVKDMVNLKTLPYKTAAKQG